MYELLEFLDPDPHFALLACFSGKSLHAAAPFHKPQDAASLWATCQSQPVFHIPYSEDVAGGVILAKLSVEIQLLLHT